MVTKLQLSPRKSKLTACDVQSSQWYTPHNGGRAALNLQHFNNHVHFSKCDRTHPSDSSCSLHTSVMQYAAACCILHTGIMQDALRRYEAYIRAYEGCVRSYCSLHAGTHATCMQPACIPSVNPSFRVIMVVSCFICSARGHRQTVV